MEEKKCLHCGLQEFEEYKQGPDAVIYSKVRNGLIKKREIGYCPINLGQYPISLQPLFY